MKSKIKAFLKKKGISVISDNTIDEQIELWKQWYKSEVKDFHTYHVYTGTKKLSRARKSLHMGSQVCRDWADLLINEKVEITVDDYETQEILNSLLNQINFRVRGNNLIETAFALGGGFFIQYFDGEKVNQKYVTQDYMLPITFDSGRLTEAAFCSNKTIDGKKYIYLEVHLKNESGFYVIDNFILEAEKEETVEVSKEFYEKCKIKEKFVTKSKTPCFQMLRPNIANVNNFNSPYGMSVYSSALDVFKTCDIVFDAYSNEITLGRKRIFVEDGTTNVHYDTKTGDTVRTFDPNDDVFYRLPENNNANDRAPIVESNMELRIDELDKALQTQLNLISQKCGFGANGYKWENGNVTTATQVISENSKMFRTLKKHEEMLKTAIVDMARSLLYFEKEYFKNNKIKLDTEITVNFDDSIIEDTAEIKRQALLELNAGIIDEIEYLKIVYKLTEEQAIERYNKIQARRPEIQEEPEGV